MLSAAQRIHRYRYLLLHHQLRFKKPQNNQLLDLATLGHTFHIQLIVPFDRAYRATTMVNTFVFFFSLVVTGEILEGSIFLPFLNKCCFGLPLACQRNGSDRVNRPYLCYSNGQRIAPDRY